MASITLSQEQYAQFQSLLKEKEQRDAMIITSAKGNLTVKSNAFGTRGRVFLQPVREKGITKVRTGGNLPASFHIEATTNRLICVIQTDPLMPKDIEYWHSQFTNRSGDVNVGQYVQAPQTVASAPYTPAPQQITPTPTVSAPIGESEDNPSAETIKKAKKYVDAGAYPDLETAIREVLKSKRK